MIQLNLDQERIKNAAIHWFFNESNQVFEIDGAAGTGKTFLIFQILKALGLNENQYYAMAYTGQASIVLRTRGFKTARSIHSTLYEVVDVVSESEDMAMKYGLTTKRKDFRLKEYIDPQIRLFFIDEAFMVPNYMVKDILSFGIKVIACGDAHQLPPIGDNPGFLINSGVHHLTQLMRQAELDPIVYLADRAMNGLPIHAGVYGNTVLVINDDEFCPEMIGYADECICGTNRTRDIVNSYVRQIAGFSSHQLPCFGEKVICRNNNWHRVEDGIALANGLSGTIINNPDASSFTRYTGQNCFLIDFKPDLVDSIFFQIPVDFNYFSSPFDIRQDLKKKKESCSWMKGELFEFAYCITTHLSQGGEYRRGIYIEEFLKAQIQNQLNYTAITRFKTGMIYIKKKQKYFNIPF